MPAGRPKLNIDPEKVKALARVGCPTTEIAAVLGCSVDTLDRNFADAIKEGWRHRNFSVRRAQYDLAVNGKNPAMLIWLGKQYLAQTDKANVNVSTLTDSQIVSLLEASASDGSEEAGDCDSVC